MKISNREKIMLFILGIILVGFGYFNFIYLGQVSKIEAKSKEESQIKEKYETAKATIDSLENKKSDVNLLKAKINNESTPFYPTISQEHIILEIDKMLEGSNVKGAIKFNPIVCDSVENVGKNTTMLPDSTLQPIVDKYNNKVTINDNGNTVSNTSNTTNNNNNQANNNNNNTVNSNSTNKNGNVDNGSASNNKNNSNSTQSNDKKKDTVQYVKFQVDLEGSYDNIYKFISVIGENERKIVINSVKLSSDALKGMKGTVNLEIYSIPKIDDDLAQYLKWDLNNNYGKSVPFSTTGTTDESLNTTATNEKSTAKTAITSDFLASVKSVTSDLPKIMIGQAKDDLRTTYVYGDSNSEEKAEMIFTQNGDKYYYKYKTSKGAFPANYNELGEEFIPMSNDIGLTIISDSRVDANDNSALRLNIINKTDKIVDVNISGDDSANPRVAIDGDNNNIKVNKN